MLIISWEGIRTVSMDCVPHSYLQVGEWQVGI